MMLVALLLFLSMKQYIAYFVCGGSPVSSVSDRAQVLSFGTTSLTLREDLRNADKEVYRNQTSQVSTLSRFPYALLAGLSGLHSSASYHGHVRC